MIGGACIIEGMDSRRERMGRDAPTLAAHKAANNAAAAAASEEE